MRAIVFEGYLSTFESSKKSTTSHLIGGLAASDGKKNSGSHFQDQENAYQIFPSNKISAWSFGPPEITILYLHQSGYKVYKVYRWQCESMRKYAHMGTAMCPEYLTECWNELSLNLSSIQDSVKTTQDFKKNITSAKKINCKVVAYIYDTSVARSVKNCIV